MSPSSAPLFTSDDRTFLDAVVRAGQENPFAPARGQTERAALGELGPPAPRDDLRRAAARLTPIIERARERLVARAAASPADLTLYKDACLSLLYDRYAERLRSCIEKDPARVDFYSDFANDHARLGDFPGGPPKWPTPEHVFACGFQMQRALHYISSSLLGGSVPAARLRAEVWESIFTHDLRRYLRTMYARMDETATLVLGATGTGKELVARAIGLSRYVPFDAGKGCFAADHAASFHGINLSAFAPAVIESELFGHGRGAFTGALRDKRGWLELGGTMFLDEIGEISEDIQVKLLRVLQERRYQRVGETEDQRFVGKIIAATHQNLVGLMKEGAFRLDLYMRICADRICTPSLREMLDAAPAERRTLVRHIAAKVAGPEEADELTDEVEAWIDAKLPPDYAWPGNVRELEQCVRRRLVHHSCRPIELSRGTGSAEAENDDADFARAFREGKLSAEEVLERYTTIVQAQTGSCRETAKRLGVDRRAVTRRVDHALLARLAERRDRENGGED